MINSIASEMLIINAKITGRQICKQQSNEADREGL